MPIVRIPTPLRKFTNGAEEVNVVGRTVAEVIDELGRNYGGLKDTVCEKGGNLRRFVNIYVNDEDIRFLQSLDTPVNDEDEVSIVPAIAGGTPGVLSIS